MTSLLLCTESYGSCNAVVASMLWSVGAAVDCTEENLTGCKLLVSVRGQQSAVVPWYSQAVVKDICSRYEEFVQCLHNVLPSCEMSDKLAYEGLRDTYDFICNSGFDDYVQYQPCFANPGVQTEASRCNDTLHNKLAYVKTYNASYRRDRLCQYSDDYVDCVGNVVKSFCGMEAELWQTKYDAKSLCPALVSQGCLGWTAKCETYGSSATATDSPQTSTPSWFIIVLSLAIALASLVIVASVVLLACFKFCPACRRKRATRHQQNATSQSSRRPSLRVDMPPPYPGPFVPCTAADGAASNAPWLHDGAVRANGASGGRDVVEKKVPLDEDSDDDEGHFVPDAVEMDAKLAEVIPPPPCLNEDRRHRRHDHHHHHRHHHQQQQQQQQKLRPAAAANDCFVPDDTPADKSRGVCQPKSSTSSSAGWQPRSGGSDSGTGASFSMSSAGSPPPSANTGGSSASSRPWSPSSYCVPSTASSSSLSFQSRRVLTDDADTTQTEVDYY